MKDITQRAKKLGIDPSEILERIDKEFAKLEETLENLGIDPEKFEHVRTLEQMAKLQRDFFHVIGILIYKDGKATETNIDFLVHIPMPGTLNTLNITSYEYKIEVIPRGLGDINITKLDIDPRSIVGLAKVTVTYSFPDLKYKEIVWVIEYIRTRNEAIEHFLDVLESLTFSDYNT
jgi:hypothetical protein